MATWDDIGPVTALGLTTMIVGGCNLDAFHLAIRFLERWRAVGGPYWIVQLHLCRHAAANALWKLFEEVEEPTKEVMQRCARSALLGNLSSLLMPAVLREALAAEEEALLDVVESIAAMDDVAEKLKPIVDYADMHPLRERCRKAHTWLRALLRANLSEDLQSAIGVTFFESGDGALQSLQMDRAALRATERRLSGQGAASARPAARPPQRKRRAAPAAEQAPAKKRKQKQKHKGLLRSSALHFHEFQSIANQFLAKAYLEKSGKDSGPRKPLSARDRDLLCATFGDDAIAADGISPNIPALEATTSLFATVGRPEYEAYLQAHFSQKSVDARYNEQEDDGGADGQDGAAETAGPPPAAPTSASRRRSSRAAAPFATPPAQKLPRVAAAAASAARGRLGGLGALLSPVASLFGGSSQASTGDEPRPPRKAFAWFQRQRREQLRATFEAMSEEERRKKKLRTLQLFVWNKWKSLSAAERQPYEQLEREDEARYERRLVAAATAASAERAAAEEAASRRKKGRKSKAKDAEKPKKKRGRGRPRKEPQEDAPAPAPKAKGKRRKTKGASSASSASASASTSSYSASEASSSTAAPAEAAEAAPEVSADVMQEAERNLAALPKDATALYMQENEVELRGLYAATDASVSFEEFASQHFESLDKKRRMSVHGRLGKMRQVARSPIRAAIRRSSLGKVPPELSNGAALFASEEEMVLRARFAAEGLGPFDDEAAEDEAWQAFVAKIFEALDLPTRRTYHGRAGAMKGFGRKVRKSFASPRKGGEDEPAPASAKKAPSSGAKRGATPKKGAPQGPRSRSRSRSSTASKKKAQSPAAAPAPAAAPVPARAGDWEQTSFAVFAEDQREALLKGFDGEADSEQWRDYVENAFNALDGRTRLKFHAVARHRRGELKGRPKSPAAKTAEKSPAAKSAKKSPVASAKRPRGRPRKSAPQEPELKTQEETPSRPSRRASAAKASRRISSQASSSSSSLEAQEAGEPAAKGGRRSSAAASSSASSGSRRRSSRTAQKRRGDAEAEPDMEAAARSLRQSSEAATLNGASGLQASRADATTDGDGDSEGAASSGKAPAAGESSSSSGPSLEEVDALSDADESGAGAAERGAAGLSPGLVSKLRQRIRDLAYDVPGPAVDPEFPELKRGMRVSKFFSGHGWHDGTVIGRAKVEQGIYFYVLYDDGDEEDMPFEEVCEGLVKYRKGNGQASLHEKLIEEHGPYRPGQRVRIVYEGFEYVGEILALGEPGTYHVLFYANEDAKANIPTEDIYEFTGLKTGDKAQVAVRGRYEDATVTGISGKGPDATFNMWFDKAGKMQAGFGLDDFRWVAR